MDEAQQKPVLKIPTWLKNKIKDCETSFEDTDNEVEEQN